MGLNPMAALLFSRLPLTDGNGPRLEHINEINMKGMVKSYENAIREPRSYFLQEEACERRS